MNRTACFRELLVLARPAGNAGAMVRGLGPTLLARSDDGPLAACMAVCFPDPRPGTYYNEWKQLWGYERELLTLMATRVGQLSKFKDTTYQSDLY